MVKISHVRSVLAKPSKGAEAEIVGRGPEPLRLEIVGESDTLSFDLDQFLVKLSLKNIKNYEFPAISE